MVPLATATYFREVAGVFEVAKLQSMQTEAGMGEDIIPLIVREFILARIDSIAQLEALLLLYREPAVAWDCRSVAERLYVSEDTAAALLESLVGLGLATRQGDRFVFDGRTARQAETIALLSEHYARHLIPVTNLVHAKPRRIQEFANAFRLKKET